MTPSPHDSIIRRLDTPAAERFFAAPFERPAPPWPWRAALALFAIVGVMAIIGVLIAGDAPRGKPEPPARPQHVADYYTSARCPECGRFIPQGLERCERHDGESERDKTAREFGVRTGSVKVKGQGK